MTRVGVMCVLVECTEKWIYFGPFSFTSSLESNMFVVSLKWAEPLDPGCHPPVSYTHTHTHTETVICTLQLCVIHKPLLSDGKDCALEQLKTHNLRKPEKNDFIY